MYDGRIAFKDVKELALSGSLLMAPPNQTYMCADYMMPAESAVACPNQNVECGMGSLPRTL